jgi:hypothetical protein
MGDRWWLLSHTNGISSSFPSELYLSVFVVGYTSVLDSDLDLDIF